MLAFRATDTPVHLPVLDAGAMRLVHPGDAGAGHVRMGDRMQDLDPALHECEGRLWSEAWSVPRHVPPYQARRFLGLDFLLHEAAVPGAHDEGWTSWDAFTVGTPLAALSEDGRCVPGLGLTTRGGAEALPRGRVVDDLTDEARKALAVFVAGSLRVSDGRLFLAHEGEHQVMLPPRLVEAGDRPRPGFRTDSPRYALNMLTRGGVCVRSDRSEITAFAEAAGIPEPTHEVATCRAMDDYLGCVRTGRARRFAAVLAGAHSLRTHDLRPLGEAELAMRNARSAATGVDADVMAHANEMCARTLSLVEAGGAASEPGVHALLRWAALGSVGGVGPGDAEEALLAAREAAASRATRLGPCARRARLALVVTYVDHVAWRVLRAGPDAVDGEALAGLGA